MRELEQERENKENEPARRSLNFGGDTRHSQLKPCDSNVGIGAGKRLRSGGDEEEAEELDSLWGEAKSPSKLLTGVYSSCRP
jgi:hypothetical protein